jgi:hypothetical protein
MYYQVIVRFHTLREVALLKTDNIIFVWKQSTLAGAIYFYRKKTILSSNTTKPVEFEQSKQVP